MQCQEDQCKANLCKSGQLSRTFALSPLEIQMGGAIKWVFSSSHNSIFRTQSLPKNHSSLNAFEFFLMFDESLRKKKLEPNKT